MTQIKSENLKTVLRHSYIYISQLQSDCVEQHAENHNYNIHPVMIGSFSFVK